MRDFIFSLTTVSPLAERPASKIALLTWADATGKGFQTIQSLLAIGSGGILGRGIGQSRQKYLWVPEPHNDFIFSVIGEEFGFFGCIFVLAVLLFIVFRCIVVATSARDTFSQLVAAGINAEIIENTGMSLPFVSYGGSSMWTNMVAIGLILNIRRKETKSLFEGGSL